ncbi:MAG: hypothetical protein KDI79_09205 [Anaerolineae bacterium]|nr:hypothetical protein [Anaerolineae bacterium]
MKINKFSEFNHRERILLLGLGLLGLVGPNGVFLYFALFRWADVLTTMHDPVAMAFITEAFFVMGILAYYFAKITSEKKWLTFIALSLIGGLGFSIPIFLVANGSDKPIG